MTSYTSNSLLSGENGYHLKALALSSLNFYVGSQLANHEDTKESIVQHNEIGEGIEDDLSSTFQSSEVERIKIPLDALASVCIATYALLQDLGDLPLEGDNGTISTPFAWLKDRAMTPTKAVLAAYQWRSDTAAKAAAEKAALLGMENASEVASKTLERSKAALKERMMYALAEVKSVSDNSIATLDNDQLVNLIEDNLDLIKVNLVKMTKAAADRDIQRAKARLSDGLFASFDIEVLLFSKSKDQWTDAE